MKSMTAMMTDEFRDERAVKSFREMAPTYSRVFAGFSKWSKDEMDRFADYYDATFRVVGTTLYVDRVPSAVRGLRLDGGVLSWEPSAGPTPTAVGDWQVEKAVI